MISNNIRVMIAALSAVACGADPNAALHLRTRPEQAAAAVEDRVLEMFTSDHPGVGAVRDPGTGWWRDDERPDLLLVTERDAAAVYDHRAMLDLAPYLPRVGIVPAAYDSTVFALFRRGQTIFAIPRGYSPIVLAYDRNAFERVDLADPTNDWTWDDFLAAARQLTRDTRGTGAIDQWGIALESRVDLWLPWIWSGGGDVICADGLRSSGCLDSRATIAALRWYGEWVTVHGIAAPGAEASLAAFARGRVAMITTDHSSIPLLRRLATAGGVNAGFVEIPHRAGFGPRTVLVASAYAVPAAAPRRKLSVQLAAALTDSVAQDIGENAGYELPPSERRIRELVASDRLGWEATFLGAVEHASPGWGFRVSAWPEVEPVLRRMMQRIIAGASADSCARDAARTLDHLLARPR